VCRVLQTVVLTGFYSRQDFDTPLRRIKFKNPQTGKRQVFLTNGLQRSPSPSSIDAASRSTHLSFNQTNHRTF